MEPRPERCQSDREYKKINFSANHARFCSSQGRVEGVYGDTSPFSYVNVFSISCSISNYFLKLFSPG